jgi:hypothetical protein
MRTLPPFICFCLIVLLPPGACAGEKAQFQLDERKWKVVFEGSRSGNFVREYAPEGESAGKWTEFFTAQFLPGKQRRVTPEAFAQGLETNLRNITTGKLAWNVLHSSPVEMMYEWTLTKDHLRPDEQEIVRVIAGSEGLHVIHYATRKVPLADDARREWIRFISAIKIVR